MEERFTVGLLVSNHYGVLNRVAGLYGKRGFNIDSLSVGPTENPEYSRMTIVSSGDEYVQDQVVKQLQKLHDVKKVYLFKNDETISVEYLLIKLRFGNGNSTKISELINSYGGKVRDFGADFITAEITGTPDKLDEFIAICEPLNILEICRAGTISMAYGSHDVLSVKNFK